MNLADVKVGKTYAAKISERIVPITLVQSSVYGGWSARNERTGRGVRIRSAQKLRFEVARSEDGRWRRV